MTDEMAEVPDDNVDVFTNQFDGVFGKFEAGASFELYYLLTALRMSDLERLEIASEAFPFQEIDFEELIQRDIDYDRVDEELVNRYLEASQQAARFFPPLLVSVVPVRSDGGIVERYEKIETKEPPANAARGELKRTWDGDKFQLLLHTKDVPTGHTIRVGAHHYNYIPHAARLRYNKDAVKLVVIDGQHRFEALRTAHVRSRKTLGQSAIPVCILFSANALAAEHPSEDIKQDFRELFVTINSTAKEVSGHFLVLLTDQKLSAHAVRSLANSWKQASPSRLPLLEWNTREASKAHQLQRPHSITTVSIVADALEKYAFKTPPTTELLLNLRSATAALEAVHGAPKMKSIKEDVFSLAQLPTLRAQIATEVRPALEALFLSPKPYADLQDVYLKAFDWLQDRIKKGTAGAAAYCDVLFGSRQIRKHDLASVTDVQDEFYKHFFRDEERINSVKPYFLNVFQQALIRGWVLICTRVGEPSALKTANAYVAALAALCFSPKENFFLSTQPYMQNTLYRGERVIVNEIAKLAWSHLILASLLHRDAIDDIAEALATDRKKKARMAERLRDLCQVSLVNYLTHHREETERFIARNWRYMELDATTKSFLTERADSDDETEREEFAERLKEVSDKRYRRAKEVLLNKLGLEAKAVKPWFTAGVEIEESE